ncbi:MAG TPA: hypothetical protein VFA46_21315 [Actinomycetes bacterium]|nr:hypothetical protein [Actinomycetes bacterium]
MIGTARPCISANHVGPLLSVKWHRPLLSVKWHRPLLSPGQVSIAALTT